MNSCTKIPEYPKKVKGKSFAWVSLQLRVIRPQFVIPEWFYRGSVLLPIENYIPDLMRSGMMVFKRLMKQR